ncbi:adenosylcobinamide-GDP ribazoletransferase [Candidatus Poribacteria bacterium]|nr:adenosylcobinamide-GDP ribazoletransferase [Candidatus Poribacteria bacterium]
MKSFIAALGFLTIIPLPSRWAHEKEALAGSIPFFPMVGLLIGAVVAALDSGFVRLFPPLLASALTVIAMVAVSGGLHMDGLGDTADGFLSSRPREQILEIMRDSRSGVMGVLAIVLIVSLKIAAVASLGAGIRRPVVFLMPLAGRCALVISLFLLPYARKEGGLVSPFLKRCSSLHTLWAVGLLAVAGWVAAGMTGLAIGGAVVIGTVLFSAYVRSKIGGLTGDTLGAVCEIVEVLPALVGAAMTAPHL